MNPEYFNRPPIQRVVPKYETLSPECKAILAEMRQPHVNQKNTTAQIGLNHLVLKYLEIAKTTNELEYLVYDDKIGINNPVYINAAKMVAEAEKNGMVTGG